MLRAGCRLTAAMTTNASGATSFSPLARPCLRQARLPGGGWTLPLWTSAGRAPHIRQRNGVASLSPWSVLDDDHLVTSAQVHALVTTLLDRCPPELHLVLITRADPPLQLSLLKSAGNSPNCEPNILSSASTRHGNSSATGLVTETRPSETCIGSWRGPKDGPAAPATCGTAPEGPGRPVGIHRAIHGRGLGHRQLSRRGGTSQPARAGTRIPPARPWFLNRMCAPLCNALTGRDDGAELYQRGKSRQPVPDPAGRRAALVPVSPPLRWPPAARACPHSAGAAVHTASAGGAVVRRTTAMPPR